MARGPLDRFQATAPCAGAALSAAGGCREWSQGLAQLATFAARGLATMPGAPGPERRRRQTPGARSEVWGGPGRKPDLGFLILQLSEWGLSCWLVLGVSVIVVQVDSVFWWFNCSASFDRLPWVRPGFYGGALSVLRRTPRVVHKQNPHQRRQFPTTNLLFDLYVMLPFGLYSPPKAQESKKRAHTLTLSPVFSQATFSPAKPTEDTSGNPNIEIAS